MFEFWNRGFFNKVVIVSGIAWMIITIGIINNLANDNLDNVSTWSSLALVDIVCLLIGLWGCDY
tara:strand:- start:820 stop:1011 length:192 start_codon:yes stop_codon:yes gene_type:complete